MALVYHLLLCCVSVHTFFVFVIAEQPTSGFVQQKYGLKIDKPYDVSVSSRYSFKDGVHSMFVLKSDKPLRLGSQTASRTELRVKGLDYTSGVWQFEGDFYVPSGSTGMSIMQIFGGKKAGPSTALMLHVTNGDLVRHGGSEAKAIVATAIYNKWTHLNVIHNADEKQIKIWINGKLTHVEPNDSNANHYFKFGVYTQSGASKRMESHWSNVKIWKQQ